MKVTAQLAVLALCTVAVAQQRAPVDAIRHLPVLARAVEGVEVTVRDRSGRPAAGATVVVLPPTFVWGDVGQERLRTLQARYGGDRLFGMVAAAAEGEARYAADAEGVVVVPREDDDAFVVATLGRSAGYARVRRGASDSHVVLQPLDEVEVRVRGADGGPAAMVPIVVSDAASHPDQWSAPIAWTDDAGAAFVPRSVLTSSSRRKEQRVVGVGFVGAKQTWRAAADVLQADSPVTWQLPAVGRVRVSWQADDPYAAPALRGALVRVVEAGSASESEFVGCHAGAWTDSRAMFDCVPLGLTIEVEMVFEDGYSQVVRAAGPKSVDEVVELRAALEREYLVTMALRGAEDEPIRGANVGVVFVGEHAWETDRRRTGPDGRLRVRVPEALRGRAFGVHVVTERRPNRPVRFVTFDVEPDAAQRGVDCGPRRLVHAPVLLAGRLVDPAGEPRSGVGVVCDVVDGIDDRKWRSSPDLEFEFAHAITDLDGRFELRHTVRRTPSLSVSDPWRVRDSSKFTPGQRDLEIVIESR